MAAHSDRSVDNSLYDGLGERWYEAKDDPIALLRAESRLLIPWVTEEINAAFHGQPVRVLDLGCGAGFLSNSLSQSNHVVTGLDLSQPSLDIAARYDSTSRVKYVHGDAARLPFDSESVNVVTAMDFLEHVSDAGAVIGEAARVLVPGGFFFWHTINRNLLSWLFAVKAVKFFVRNAPPDMHVLRLFRKPEEIRALCATHSLTVHKFRGIRPVIGSRAFISLLATGRVRDDFAFRFTRSTAITYAGFAAKNTNT